jgi:small-conductance mechanosensitive channel
LKKVILILFGLYLYAGVVDTNNSKVIMSDINQTKIEYQNKIKEIDSKLNKIDFFIKYQQYQRLESLKFKLNALEKKLRYLQRYKKYSHKKEIASLELQKTAYKQQIEIMGVGKNNLFDTIISVKPLPKPFPITNPFEIFSVINYKKEIKIILQKYESEYKEIDNIISLLNQKKEILKSLSQKNGEIDKTLQDFSLVKDIYKSKLEQIKTQSLLYIQKMDEEENYQVRKLITLLITIFISVLFFAMIKLGLRKYPKNIENIYLINKILNLLNFSVAILIIMFFYIDNATYLVTILGFASAGIAIAMKDWFMNIFGWFVIITTGNFKVGDRIKVTLQNGQVEIVGDVIDITISRIVIHEDVTLTTYTKNRRAGRIVFVPNNIIFTNPIFNYTHSGLKTVWDGIDIFITYDSNFRKAEYIAKEVVKKYAKGYTDMTRIQLNKLRSSYNIRNTNVEPRIFTFVGEYGIVVSCWYLNSYSPLALRSKISTDILEAFLKEDDIKVTYNTLNIIKKENNYEQIDETKTSL